MGQMKHLTDSEVVQSALLKISFLISQPKHIVGTQKYLLNETILLSTQNICLD